MKAGAVLVCGVQGAGGSRACGTLGRSGGTGEASGVGQVR